MTKKPYNTTQLNPDVAMERHVYHRDMFAHYLRWSHVLKRAELNMKILDFGCGSGNLAEVFYRNRFKGELYLGLDVRKKTVEAAQERFKDVTWIQFAECDLVTADVKEAIPANDWDIIVSFETLEHVGKNNVVQLLQNMYNCCSASTIVLISTPCYDEKVGAADNHTYDSGDGRGVAPHELTYEELKEKLEKFFTIKKVWGTFASVKDYKPFLHEYPGLDKIYERLHEYYDSNILSNLMAPLFPTHSRNCLWELVKK